MSRFGILLLCLSAMGCGAVICNAGQRQCTSACRSEIRFESGTRDTARGWVNMGSAYTEYRSVRSGLTVKTTERVTVTPLDQNCQGLSGE